MDKKYIYFISLLISSYFMYKNFMTSTKSANIKDVSVWLYIFKYSGIALNSYSKEFIKIITLLEIIYNIIINVNKNVKLKKETPLSPILLLNIILLIVN